MAAAPWNFGSDSQALTYENPGTSDGNVVQNALIIRVPITGTMRTLTCNMHATCSVNVLHFQGSTWCLCHPHDLLLLFGLPLQAPLPINEALSSTLSPGSPRFPGQLRLYVLLPDRMFVEVKLHSLKHCDLVGALTHLRFSAESPLPGAGSSPAWFLSCPIRKINRAALQRQVPRICETCLETIIFLVCFFPLQFLVRTVQRSQKFLRARMLVHMMMRTTGITRKE